jgi:hypothetical protein
MTQSNYVRRQFLDWVSNITLTLTATDSTFSFWDNGGCECTGVPSTVPIAGALPLFASSLGMRELLGWRRTKKIEI